MVLSPSAGDLKQSPKSCQVFKHHGDFKTSAFGSFSLLSGFSALGGNFPNLSL